MHNNVTKTGNIRTKKTCPFIKRCSQIKADCPRRGLTKASQHKCGIAKLFVAADARRVVTPHVDVKAAIEPIESWSLSDAVMLKKVDRFKPDTWIPQHLLK